jgi:hypothetical protein
VETKPCVRCGVQIHAASTRCTLCGSPQRAAPWLPPRARWALAGVVALVLVGVAAFVVSSGGSTAGAPRFRLFQAGGLTTLVPVGWSGHQVAAPTGTVKASFDDARFPDYQLALTAQRPAPGTARSRAAKLRAEAMTRLGYRQYFFGRVLFPGGRPAWLLDYESDGFAHAVYVYTACQPGVAMDVEISAPDRTELQGIAAPIAASTGPGCG